MITKEQRAEMRSTNAARRIPCDEGYEIGGAEDDLDKALDALDEMERERDEVMELIGPRIETGRPPDPDESLADKVYRAMQDYAADGRDEG